MSEFYVFRCKKCGRWSVKEVRKMNSAIFKCPYCGHREKIKKESDFGLSMEYKGAYTNPYDASIIALAENKIMGAEYEDGNNRTDWG